MQKFRHAQGAFIGLLLVVIFAAAASAAWSNREEPIPEGEQTLSGTLLPVELSLVRRGTHVLRIDGREKYYVESTQVNLRQYEGGDVLLTGTFEPNTDPDALPVLIATRAELHEEPTKEMTVELFHMELDVPESWIIQEYDDGVAFIDIETDVRMLKIYKSSQLQLPKGTPIVIGGERAVRQEKGSGSQVIHVSRGREVITFQYTPGDADSQSKLAFTQLLRSVTFDDKASSSSSDSSAVSSRASGTGSLQGSPCGGSGGVLCPSGSYCAITDPAAGIGHCEAIQ